MARVVGERQPGEVLPGDRVDVVHAGLEQTDLAIGRLHDRLAERQRNRDHPVSEIPLAVLDAGGDDGAVEPAAVAGELALDHALSPATG